jgi:SET domain-containing protein
MSDPVTQSEFIDFKTSGIHGMGGFARKDIPKGARLIEYIGERIDKAESLRRCEAGNEYIFSIDDKTDLDGSVAWNPARLLNHSCSPNAESDVLEGHIYIVATRDIATGEEITFNYGYDLIDYQEHPCHCGSPNCVGYIVAEEYFDHLRAKRLMAAAAPTIPESQL